jgi:hypothetical protein
MLKHGFYDTVGPGAVFVNGFEVGLDVVKDFEDEGFVR